MGILKALWALKAFRYAVYVLLAIGIATAFIKQREAAAVERDRLERELADEVALREEAERQRTAAQEALSSELERAEQRARENYLLRVEIDGYKADLESGVTVACPADAAYTDRMRALWNVDSGGDQSSGDAALTN